VHETNYNPHSSSSSNKPQIIYKGEALREREQQGNKNRIIPTTSVVLTTITSISSHIQLAENVIKRRDNQGEEKTTCSCSASNPHSSAFLWVSPPSAVDSSAHHH